MLLRRINKEIMELQDSLDTIGCVATRTGVNFYHWIVTIKGPVNTPYSGGLFNFDVTYPDEYPFKPPRVLCLTRIYSSSIDKNGNIGLDILGRNWAPSIKIHHIF